MDFKYKAGNVYYKIKDGIEDFFFNLKDGKKSAVIGTVLGSLVIVAATVAIVLVLLNNKPAVTPEPDTEDSSSTTRTTGTFSPTVPGNDDESVTGNKISWEPVSGAKSYLVYRANKADGKYELVTETTETSFVDETAEKGVRYYYRATAVKEDKTTTTTEKQTTTTTAAPTTTTTEAPTTTTTAAPTTTTEAPTTTTTVPPSNAGNNSGSTLVDTALAAFNSNASVSGMTVKQLAIYCGTAIDNKGKGNDPVKVNEVKGVTEQPKGYAECWQFTANYNDSDVLDRARCFGYVFKVSEGVSSAEFMASIKPAARTSYNGLIEMSVRYTATACYGPYVFYMCSYN